MVSDAPNDAASREEEIRWATVVKLGRDASVYFQCHQFSDSVEVLKELLEKKPGDPKVLHNIAVAEYFRDGCSYPRKLLDVLTSVKERSEDLAHVPSEKKEFVNSDENNMFLGSGARDVESSDHDAMEDYFDYPIATIDRNIAVILYHLHEYAHALKVLEPLYNKMGSLDKRATLQLYSLLLDVALASQDASKVADVIQCMERYSSSAIRHLDNRNIAQDTSLNQGSKSSMTTITTPDDSSDFVSTIVSKNPQVLSDDSLEYEMLLSSLDSSSQNSLNVAPNDQIKLHWSTPAINLRLDVHLAKVRLLLLTRNLKAAKRQAKLAMNFVRGGDSSVPLLLKSQLEYVRGNHRKAIKLLHTSSNRTEPAMLSLLNNNIGCVFHQLGKPNLSIFCFSKALRCSSLLRSEKSRKLTALLQDKSLLITYNCGLQYLASGKPLVAARCFRQAGAMFCDRPLFWLRFAECCLSALEKGFLRSASALDNEGAKVHVAGSGRWRHLVLDELDSQRTESDFLEDDCFFRYDHQEKLSLSFAKRCLVNALHLLNTSEKKLPKSSASTSELEGSVPSGDSKECNVVSTSAIIGSNGDLKESKCSTGSCNILRSSISTYEDICRKENHMLKQVVLGDLAFIELSLDNPLKALLATRELQKLQDCSKIYRFLSHQYAAEALCRLNRPKEAANEFSGYISGHNHVELPFNNEDRSGFEKCRDSAEFSGFTGAVEVSQEMVFLKPEEARGVLYANLTAMSTIQGDLVQASQFAEAAQLQLPNNPRTTLAAVLIDLLHGNTKDAHWKLKQSDTVRFLSDDP